MQFCLFNHHIHPSTNAPKVGHEFFECLNQPNPKINYLLSPAIQRASVKSGTQLRQDNHKRDFHLSQKNKGRFLSHCLSRVIPARKNSVCFMNSITETIDPLF